MIRNDCLISLSTADLPLFDVLINLPAKALEKAVEADLGMWRPMDRWFCPPGDLRPCINCEGLEGRRLRRGTPLGLPWTPEDAQRPPVAISVKGEQRPPAAISKPGE